MDLVVKSGFLDNADEILSLSKILDLPYSGKVRTWTSLRASTPEAFDSIIEFVDSRTIRHMHLEGMSDEIWNYRWDSLINLNISTSGGQVPLICFWMKWDWSLVPNLETLCVQSDCKASEIARIYFAENFTMPLDTPIKLKTLVLRQGFHPDWKLVMRNINISGRFPTYFKIIAEEDDMIISYTFEPLDIFVVRNG